MKKTMKNKCRWIAIFLAAWMTVCALPITALSSFDDTKALPLAAPEETSSVAPYESEMIDFKDPVLALTMNRGELSTEALLDDAYILKNNATVCCANCQENIFHHIQEERFE